MRNIPRKSANQTTALTLFNVLFLSMVLTACQHSSESYTEVPKDKEKPIHHTQYDFEVALYRALVQSYEINPDLDLNLKRLAYELSEDLHACGLLGEQPACFNYYFDTFRYLGVFSNPLGEQFFASEMNLKKHDDDWNHKLIIAFKVKEGAKISSDHLTVYLKLKERAAEIPISDYLSDERSVQVLSNLQIATGDLSKLIRQRLKNPKSLKELYHLAELLNYTEGNRGLNEVPPEIASTIARAFYENRNLFSIGEDFDYQYHSLWFLQNLSVEKALFLDITESLLKSQDLEAKMFAASVILRADESRTDVKPLVVLALDHRQLEVRVKAIEALARLPLSVDEQNKIISKIDDNSVIVMETAFETARRFNITKDHLPIISSLSESPQARVRLYAEVLLQNFDGKTAK